MVTKGGMRDYFSGIEKVTELKSERNFLGEGLYILYLLSYTSFRKSDTGSQHTPIFFFTELEISESEKLVGNETLEPQYTSIRRTSHRL